MFDTYKLIEDLCDQKGINITQMCEEADIARSNMSEYKSGRKKSLGVPILLKIANYFDVTVDYLIGNEKPPVIVSDNGQREIDEIFNSLSPDNRAKLLELARLYLDAQSSNGEKK